MNGIELFNAITGIDGDLIEKSTDVNERKSRFANGGKTVKAKRIAVRAASLVLTLSVIFGVSAVIRRSSPDTELPLDGFFTLKVYARDVYIDGVDDEKYAKRSEAEYIFGRPSADDLKYAGLWISSKAGCGIELNENGTFVFYLLKDASSYKYRSAGYFSISDGKITMFLPEEESAAICELGYFVSYISIKPENDGAMSFVKSNVVLVSAGIEDKTSTDAMDFRNIPWTLDEEKLEITFGGNRSLAFWRKDTLTREDRKYDWDRLTNTVTFPDWHGKDGAEWTGRIENGYLVISSGNKTLSLYDPAKVREMKKATFPFETVLYASGDDTPFGIVFRSDGTYTIGRFDADVNDFSVNYGVYEGIYELDEASSLSDYDGAQMIFLVPTDKYEFLPRGSALRRFEELCGDGEKLIYERDGDNVVLRSPDPEIGIVLCRSQYSVVPPQAY